MTFFACFELGNHLPVVLPARGEETLTAIDCDAGRVFKSVITRKVFAPDSIGGRILLCLQTALYNSM